MEIDVQSLFIGIGNVLLVVVAGQLRSISNRLVDLERRLCAVERSLQASNWPAVR